MNPKICFDIQANKGLESDEGRLGSALMNYIMAQPPATENGSGLNPVRHKDCGVIYGGRITQNFFCILPILNLRALHAPV